MNKRIGYSLAYKTAFIAMVIAALPSCSTADTKRVEPAVTPPLVSTPVTVPVAAKPVAEPAPKEDNYAPSLLSPATEVDLSLLNRRLQTAEKDLGAFLSFADSFRKSGNLKELAQLQKPADDYLKKHVDNLLNQGSEHSPLETTRVTAEILFIKARLFMAFNRPEEARGVVAGMKTRFSSYQKISVVLPERTTTLDEAIRSLEEELAPPATTEKK
jgi:hypothetical protein